MIAEQFGQYLLEELIGRGGMGEVYRARDTVRDRTVALKRLPAHLAADAEYRARFRKEAAIASRLTEPHIVPIHDFGEIDGRLFLDMRLVKGRDLSSVLSEDGPLDPVRAAGIIAQVASALDDAHSTGLLHRDVKPANVLLTGEPGNDFAYLADFGIARAVGGNNPDSVMTAAGATVGTLDYMAPERFLGDEVDRRADVYALACTLFELLIGHRPFTGTGPVLMHSHLAVEPPRPSTLRPGIPPALDAVIAIGMAKRPDDRYPTCGALAAAATAAAAGAPAPAGDLHTAVRLPEHPGFGAAVPHDPPRPAYTGQGAPYSGQPYTGQPHSGQPYSGQPYSGQPYTGQPNSGQPYAAQPFSGQPHPAQPQPYATQQYTGQHPAGQPFTGQAWSGPQPPAQPPGYGAPPAPRGGRPNRTPLIVGAIVVVLALIVGGGVIAWTMTGDDSDTPAVAQSAAPVVPTSAAASPTSAAATSAPPASGGGGDGSTSSQITDAADQQLLGSLAVQGFDPASCQTDERNDQATAQIVCATNWTFPTDGVLFQQFDDQEPYQNSLYAVGAVLENTGNAGCGEGYEFGQEFGYDIACGWETRPDGTRRYIVTWGSTTNLRQGFVTGDDPSEVYGWWLANTPF